MGTAFGTAAALALGKIGDAHALEPLMAALCDTFIHARSNAAEALGKIGDRNAIQPLLGVLKNKSIPREIVITALGRIGSAEAGDALLLELGDPDVSVRICTAEALSSIRDTRATAPIIALTREGDGRLREAAAKALEKLKWQPDGIEIAQ